MGKEYKEELSMSTGELYAKSQSAKKDLRHLEQGWGIIALHSALNIAGV